MPLNELENRIRERLQHEPHVAFYEDELSSVWPRSDKDREQKIKRFAAKHGWNVKIYDLGLCVIFDSKLPSK